MSKLPNNGNSLHDQSTRENKGYELAERKGKGCIYY